jgi:hypothetical protein
MVQDFEYPFLRMIGKGAPDRAENTAHAAMLRLETKRELAIQV